MPSVGRCMQCNHRLRTSKLCRVFAQAYVKAVEGFPVFDHAGNERSSERLLLDGAAASSR